ncbi:MAG: peptide ABC transporter substrate-binding protein [Verrucomicrobia bacterium]|nr:peptide ABC transporter substrate-binding protein [Verrucomicrobiota bacterium]
MRPLRLLPVLASALALLAFTACAPRETPVQAGIRTQTLHRTVGPDPANLDPHLASALGELQILSALFEGLVAEDPVTLAPIAGVARNWQISADGTTYTFLLRPEARWSDGRPLVAADFVASLRRALTPALGAPNAELLYPVLNAEAYHKARLADFSAVGITAPDPQTLRIVLEYPSAHFLSLLTHPVWFPVPLHAIAAAGPADARGNRWASAPASFVGNGAFTLQEWRAGQVLVAAASPTYWDAATVKLRAVHFHAFDSVDAQERAYRAGQLHVIDALPAGRIDAWRAEAPEQLRTDPFLDAYFYRFNTNRPFLSDVRIRRALSLALDREQLVNALLRGGQRPATSFVPPGTGGYNPPAIVRHDLAAAKALLAEAGHPDGQGLPVFELLYNTSENHRRVAETVQNQWRALGVQTRLINQEFATLLEARRSGDFQILRSGWVADYDDPISFLALFTGQSAQNFTGWSDPAYDRALYQAARTTDTAARQALLHQAETRLLEAAPILPLYVNTHVFLLHPSVRGWHPTLLDRHPLKAVSLAP